jgi:hypothetical protein
MNSREWARWADGVNPTCVLAREQSAACFNLKELAMRIHSHFIHAVIISLFGVGVAFAQVLPGLVGAELLPNNPTSADNIKLSLANRTCGSFLPYSGNPYRVTMSQNNIVVALGEHLSGLLPLCPPNLREEIDLGRLPPGAYTVSVIEAPSGMRPGPLISNAPFTVTDARATKTAPYVRLDYSGHWWDPNDSGWGLFIWHDARDNVLAAWFTYGADGKAIWYVFQPTWATSSATVTTPLRQTSRLPGPTSPPPGPTTYVSVGTASLDFTNFGTADEGKLSYTFTGGAQTVRNIQRFKP